MPTTRGGVTCHASYAGHSHQRHRARVRTTALARLDRDDVTVRQRMIARPNHHHAARFRPTVPWFRPRAAPPPPPFSGAPPRRARRRRLRASAAAPPEAPPFRRHRGRAVAGRVAARGRRGRRRRRLHLPGANPNCHRASRTRRRPLPGASVLARGRRAARAGRSVRSSSAGGLLASLVARQSFHGSGRADGLALSRDRAAWVPQRSAAWAIERESATRDEAPARFATAATADAASPRLSPLARRAPTAHTHRGSLARAPQLNDDTILVSKQWAGTLIGALAGSELRPNFGVAGRVCSVLLLVLTRPPSGRRRHVPQWAAGDQKRCHHHHHHHHPHLPPPSRPLDTNNARILTHAFVHRTHVELFGCFFPPAFKNWWSDDWISTVYGAHATFARRDVIITHNVQSQKLGAFNR